MLWVAVITLAFLWALGSVPSFTMGGYIHVLMVAAVVLLFVRLIKSPRPTGAGPASW